MFRGLFLTSIATVAMSAALFSRKNKAGWLDELDGIRGDALVSPSGGTAAVMGEVSSLADTGLGSGPIEWRDSAELAAELDAWRAGAPAPGRVATAELVTAPADAAAADVVTATDPVGTTTNAPAPPAMDVPTDPGPAAPVAAAGDAPLLPPPPAVVRPDLPPPPAPPAAGPDLPPPPPTPASVAPAPHRAYPAEMWHPDVMAPVEPEPEVVVDAATAEVDEAEPPRFRFAALRTVEPLGSDREDVAVPTDLTPAITEVPSASPAPAVDAPTIAEPSSTPDAAAAEAPDSFGSVAAYLGPADEPDAAMTATVPEIAAPDWTTPPDVPLVPEPAPGVGGALITGPVARRTRRADEARDGADRSITFPGSMRGIADASDQPVSRVLPVGQDGTVTLNAGLLRISPSVRSEVRLDSGRIRLELAAGWCWTTLGLDADPVTVLLPNGSVAMAAGTTALVSVEDDGTTFVVVANGAAVLVEPFGSTMLAGSTVALVPVGCSPQVDEATFAEIEAEPLVASNRALDAGR